MLIYPAIDPVAFEIGPLQIHWYGIMYLIAFASAWFLGMYRARKAPWHWNKTMVNDLIFYGVLGTVIGGRVGYMLVYQLPELSSHPLSLFKIWEGGMSFHGGLVGVMISMWFFSRKFKKSYFDVVDFTVPLVPLGLGAGRLGNFINGELCGRVTDMPWGMVYPHIDQLPRHPSQIYEFLLEGLLLFVIVWIYSSKPRPRMAVSGMFSLCYGVFRFGLEFFRQPDTSIGFVAFNWMTMGQLLSVPMILLGITLLGFAYCKRKESTYV